MKLSLSLLLATAALLHAEEVPGLIFPKIQISASSPVLQEVIETVNVEEGDNVQEGQILVQLRSAREVLAVQEAQKLVENAEFVYRGAAALAKDRMGSKEQELKAKTELDLAKIRLASSEELLREKTIRAKISGIVVKKYKEAGEAVDRVEKLVDIVNIDQVLAQFYVSPRYLSTLEVNQPVTVHVPDVGNLTLSGKIDFIDPRVEASSGLVRVKVLLENKDHKVKSGLKATADFGKKP